MVLKKKKYSAYTRPTF